jgi:hypothetical protein
MVIHSAEQAVYAQAKFPMFQNPLRANEMLWDHSPIAMDVEHDSLIEANICMHQYPYHEGWDKNGRCDNLQLTSSIVELATSLISTSFLCSLFVQIIPATLSHLFPIIFQFRVLLRALCLSLPTMSKSKDEKEEVFDSDSGSKSPQEASIREFVNASGHVQEVNRNFNLLSLTAVGLVNGMVWPVLGGSILVAIFNGGPPGVLYELYGYRLLTFPIC